MVWALVGTAPGVGSESSVAPGCAVYAEPFLDLVPVGGSPGLRLNCLRGYHWEAFSLWACLAH